MPTQAWAWHPAWAWHQGLAGLVAVAVVAAIFAGCSGDGTPRTEPSQPDEAAGPASGADPPLPEIDPALVRYEQTAEIPTGLEKASALAVGPGDDVYAGGDRRLCRFAADGTKLSEIPLGAEPTCVAVGGADHVVPGRIYVGLGNHVEVFDSSGTRVAAWEPPGPKSLLTSLAAAERHVFAADAGERIVWRYTPDGRQKTRIGDPDPARNISGFFIPSPYFDLGLGADGLVYVVNPRALRLEGYTAGGDLEVTWGKGSPAIEDFFGCCNPAHFAVLPDGRFVTAEKGFPRIKVYSQQGKFECVVAGPRQMKHAVADLAADRRGRVLALDPSTASVRVFQRKKDVSGEKR
jgi:sugar lactone lactonase YvrE